MEQVTEPLVVGVRFSKVGKVYHFASDEITDIKVGDMVVVETSRGWQLGQVAQIITNADPPPEGWKTIDRRATPRDLLLRQMWQMKEAEVVSACKAKAADLRLVGIKIVSAEYSFDGARLTIHFSSETEEKYDLKSLRADMQKMFAPSQVEMRQIGPRDVAKTHCGMGACGLETRCCCLFLTEFSSISIRMAKEQGISLTPTEITGMCGRLRCCLIYEYDTYVEARAKLPKKNKRVHTPVGDGKVVDVIPLRGAVMVDIPEVGVREFSGEEVALVDADGGQQSQPKPYHGTQQASEMDQAITGDEQETDFVISADTPSPASDWENPPTTTQPRSMPRTDRPKPGRSRSDRPRRERQAGEEGHKRSSGRQRGQRQSQGETTQKAGKPGDRPDRPSRKDDRQKGARSEQQPGAKSGGPEKPRGETGSGAAPKGGRDQRRRRGRRRDSNDREERA